MKKIPNIRKKPKWESVNKPPGEPVFVGKKERVFVMEITSYSNSDYKHFTTQNPEDAFPYKKMEENITWINVSGLNNIEQIKKIGKEFELHPLVIEDIVNTQQRPKLETHSTYIFFVLKMLFYDKDEIFTKEHLSVILGKNWVLTFQEDHEGDVFDELRKRISETKGRIRFVGTDYLMYTILDAVIDNYFGVIEQLGDKIQNLEDELLQKEQRKNIVEEIQYCKRELLRVYKAVMPLRETIKQLEKNKHSYIKTKTRRYLNDLSDHIIQVCESVEIYREMSWSLMDMYMSTISNKMNEVMKVLTMMASIFIPLTFIVGVYGMNFEYMPELQMQYAYYVVWGVMIVIVIIMLIYFKRKKWL